MFICFLRVVCRLVARLRRVSAGAAGLAGHRALAHTRRCGQFNASVSSAGASGHRNIATLFSTNELQLFHYFVGYPPSPVPPRRLRSEQLTEIYSCCHVIPPRRCRLACEEPAETVIGAVPSSGPDARLEEDASTIQSSPTRTNEIA